MGLVLASRRRLGLAYSDWLVGNAMEVGQLRSYCSEDSMLSPWQRRSEDDLPSKYGAEQSYQRGDWQWSEFAAEIS